MGFDGLNLIKSTSKSIRVWPRYSSCHASDKKISAELQSRGSVKSFDASTLVLVERSGETLTLMLAATPQGRILKLRCKDVEKTVIVPDNVPVVTVRPGDRSLLVPGARVLVTAQLRDGKPTALRAGRARRVVSPMLARAALLVPVVLQGRDPVDHRFARHMVDPVGHEVAVSLELELLVGLRVCQ